MAAGEIPDKQFFKIGEVAEIAGVEPYVLRYWESEFRAIRPDKSRSNQRLYTRRDVENVLQIKRLLYEEGYRIDGAKKRLRELAGDEVPVSYRRIMSEVRHAIADLEKIVDDDERS